MIKLNIPDFSPLEIKCYEAKPHNEYELIPIPNILGQTTVAIGYANLKHYFQNAENKIKIRFPKHADGISREHRKEIARIVAERNIFLKAAEAAEQSMDCRPY